MMRVMFSLTQFGRNVSPCTLVAYGTAVLEAVTGRIRSCVTRSVASARFRTRRSRVSRSSRTSSSASSSESSTIRTRNGACISEPSGHWRCPVHEQPVQPELLGRLGEFHEVHRFPHIAVGAEPVAIDEVALLVGGGQDH